MKTLATFSLITAGDAVACGLVHEKRAASDAPIGGPHHGLATADPPGQRDGTGSEAHCQPGGEGTRDPQRRPARGVAAEPAAVACARCRGPASSLACQPFGASAHWTDLRLMHLRTSMGLSVGPPSLRPQHAAACIVCCYISDAARPTATQDSCPLTSELDEAEDAIGWHLNAAEVSDPFYLSDAGSIGIHRSTGKSSSSPNQPGSHS
jgi:hypothetical protein